jgi:hypothetical protein
MLSLARKPGQDAAPVRLAYSIPRLEPDRATFKDFPRQLWGARNDSERQEGNYETNSETQRTRRETDLLTEFPQRREVVPYESDRLDWHQLHPLLHYVLHNPRRFGV